MPVANSFAIFELDFGTLCCSAFGGALGPRVRSSAGGAFFTAGVFGTDLAVAPGDSNRASAKDGGGGFVIGDVNAGEQKSSLLGTKGDTLGHDSAGLDVGTGIVVTLGSTSICTKRFSSVFTDTPAFSAAAG